MNLYTPNLDPASSNRSRIIAFDWLPLGDVAIYTSNRPSMRNSLESTTTNESFSTNNSGTPEPQPTSFKESFFEGFYENCSGCGNKNQGSSKCYECNVFLCAKCEGTHKNQLSASTHTFYRFNSLTERLSPPTQRRSNGPANMAENLSPCTSLLSFDSGSFEEGWNWTLSHLPPIGSTYSTRSSPAICITPVQDLSHRELSPYVANVRGKMSNTDQPSTSTGSSSSSPAFGNSICDDKRSVSLAVGSNRPFRANNDLLRIQNQLSSMSINDPSTTATSPSSLDITNDDKPVFDNFPCRYHNEKDVIYWCLQCVIPVCSPCWHDGHIYHRFNIINNEQMLEMSDNMAAKIRELMGVFRKSLDGLQTMCWSIQDKANQVSVEILNYLRLFFTEEKDHDIFLARVDQARHVKQKLLGFQMANIRRCFSKLAAQLELIMRRYDNPYDRMVANFEAFKSIKEARDLGDVTPCEDDFFFFTASAPYGHYKAQLVTTRAPITNSALLGKKPQVYLRSGISLPLYAVEGVNARPIYSCKNRVLVDTSLFRPKLVWGKPGSATGDLCRPWGITINRFNHVIVADRSNCRVQVFDLHGNFLFTFGRRGNGEGEFDRPSAVACSPNDDLVVADKDNHRIQVFNCNGDFLFMFGEKGTRVGQFMYPWDVACDALGNILVSDTRNHRIQLFTWNGILIKLWGGELTKPRLFDSPRGVAFDPAGNILFTDFNLHSVVYIERITGAITYKGSQGYHKGQFNRPQGICCDDRGWFIVADSKNHRVQVFDQNGDYMWMQGYQGHEEPGQFDRCTDIAIDQYGHIHVIDFGNDRVQVY